MKTNIPDYDITAVRVTGYRKKKEGLPCEDSYSFAYVKDSVILAVADGHGDPKCVYAASGARIAAAAAIRVLTSYVEKMRRASPSRYFAKNRDAIGFEIALAFRHAALRHYAKCHPTALPASLETLDELIETAPFGEIGRIVGKEDEAHKKRRELAEWLDAMALCYGTTLRASVIGPDYVFSLAVGDGDTVALLQSGKTVWLLPKGESYDTSTYSMCYPTNRLVECMSFSLIQRRVNLRDQDCYDLKGVVLSTDGLRNSFVDDELFADFIRSVLEEKDSRCERSLRRRLETLTRNSVYGDDITLLLAPLSVFTPDLTRDDDLW